MGYKKVMRTLWIEHRTSRFAVDWFSSVWRSPNWAKSAFTYVEINQPLSNIFNLSLWLSMIYGTKRYKVVEIEMKLFLTRNKIIRKLEEKKISNWNSFSESGRKC